MKNQRILKKYYKTAFFKGRNSFARITDFIAFRIIAFILLYIWFAPALKNPILKFILPLISLAILSLIAELFKSIRFERFIVQERERIRTKILTDALLVSPRQELIKSVHMHLASENDNSSDSVFVFQKTAPVNLDDILKLYRKAKAKRFKSITLFCTSDPTAEALSFISNHEEELCIRIILPNELINSIKHTIGNETIDEFITAQSLKAKEQRKKAFTEPFKQNSAKKYFLAAILLFIASFFVRYPLYYRLIAALSSSFGFISLYFSKANSVN